MITGERREACRRGGRARAAQFTSASQSAAARAGAAKTDMAALGHKGFLATVHKHGYLGWLDYSRKTRLAKPSAPERAVQRVLDGLGVQYEREFVALDWTERPVIVDFAVMCGDQRKLVEVQGGPHYKSALNNGNPDGRKERDDKRLARLREAYDVLVLDEPDETAIAMFIGVACD